ncbi:UDP-N-acetylglucosamine 2-epimerase (non-hydrolyzing), partial [Vibrio sp. 10N.261.45.F1]
TIVDNLNVLLTNKAAYQMMSFAHNPYGDGKTCEKICDNLVTK